MRSISKIIAAPLLTLLVYNVVANSAFAQLSPPKGNSFGGSVSNSKKVVPGIAWYGVLNDGLTEARRTGKPILFVTAAAQCNGVPGIW